MILSHEEREDILEISNRPAYASLPPSQIIPSLADEGIYIASESSFYRVIKEAGQLKHRGKAKPRTVEKPEPYVATGPNQVWTWDITYLPTVIKGSFINDNPYSEALFKTLKYKPGYPAKPFESLEESRDWVLTFVRWYNNEHKLSSLKFVSPALRHQGKDFEILKRRKEVYEEARKNNPARWSGKTRNWDAPAEVHLNPGRKTEQGINIKKAA